jgi:catechol 2,3-dioxygenase-like lactoylglutathione lyase family enzyme
MIGSAPVSAVVATTDIARAREFYGGTLGLKASSEAMPDPSVALYECGGGSTLLVYERETAGDSAATCANFSVGDVESAVEGLRANGVVFEDYDMGEIKTENGILRMGDFAAAWFKDPDGNILGLTSQGPSLR